ncbi:MAG: GyrI-like domain-containing protein, partial [Flavobacteriaceae bacterium]
QVYSVSHKGPYRHIANAWSAAHMHLRSKQFKPLGKTPPMELYWNSPKDTAELELKSEILFPAKA